ncbi:MAG: hypothetical protein RLY97_1156, partial [Pseudomonadota bacterium]
GLGYALGHSGAEADGVIELLYGGLSFDLLGLMPAEKCPMPDIAHRYGFTAPLANRGLEAITLVAGEHLRGAENLLPVVRGMTAIAAKLTALSGALAVAWHPARSLIAAEPFVRSITSWLDGGAFPALGLTALIRDVDSGLRSEGLAFFTGQELRIEPIHGESAAGAAKIALRLIHMLVGSEAVTKPYEFTGPAGENLRAEPSGNGKYIRIYSKA